MKKLPSVLSGKINHAEHFKNRTSKDFVFTMSQRWFSSNNSFGHFKWSFQPYMYNNLIHKSAENLILLRHDLKLHVDPAPTDFSAPDLGKIARIFGQD